VFEGIISLSKLFASNGVDYKITRLCEKFGKVLQVNVDFI